MMTTQKNPLRVLASRIVSDCKANGLKQTVVLNTLTKSAGFHSIQCNDNKPASQRSALVPVHVLSHFRALLSGHYSVRHQDLSTFSFLEHGHLDALDSELGDGLFQILWSQLTTTPESFLTFAHGASESFCALAELAEERLAANGESGFDEQAIRALVNEVEFHPEVREYVITELDEGGEGAHASAEDWLSHAIHQLNGLNLDVEPVCDAFRADPTYRQWLKTFISHE